MGENENTQGPYGILLATNEANRNHYEPSRKLPVRDDHYMQIAKAACAAMFGGDRSSSSHQSEEGISC